MTERQRKKRNDYIGFMFWISIFCLVIFSTLRAGRKEKPDLGYVMFPSDEEIREVELGERPKAHVFKHRLHTEK